MWRWIIRLWVSVVLFVFLMFCSSVLLIRVTHLFAKIGFPLLLQETHAHVIVTMFLLGMATGQVVLGANFTGRGWFRSKSGQSYEGFKLEKIKPLTWLLVSPVFVLGIVAWLQERRESGAHSNLFFVNFYNDVLTPNCSFSWWKNYQLYPLCGVQLLSVGIWTAAVGYSCAPMVRRSFSKLLRRIQASSAGERQKSLMKEKTGLQ